VAQLLVLSQKFHVSTILRVEKQHNVIKSPPYLDKENRKWHVNSTGKITTVYKAPCHKGIWRSEGIAPHFPQTWQ
jgi:hypothetical protein